MADDLKFTLKSMNQKIRRVGERFGVTSLPYKQLIADIEHNFRGMYHFTNKGIIQVNQRKGQSFNTYQAQMINRVSRRAGVKRIVANSKKRLEKQGITKPTAADINKEVQEHTRIQEEFDKALDLVYEHELAGDLPVDIRERYMKIYRSGKGAGMGVSTDDVTYIESRIIEFDHLRDQLNDVSAGVYQIARENGVRVSDNAKIAIEKAIQGELTTDDIKDLISNLNEYANRIIIDPENADYIS